jgi:hypothetical protein
VRPRSRAHGPSFVMAGLVPASHAAGSATPLKTTLRTFNRGGDRTAWMTGTSPVMTAWVLVWAGAKALLGLEPRERVRIERAWNDHFGHRR